MNAFIPVDEATFDDRWPLNRGSRSRRRAGSSGRIRLGACHNPRRDGDDQQSSFRIPSREAGHSSASGRSVRGCGLVMFQGESRPRLEIRDAESLMHCVEAFLPLQWRFVEANLDRYVRFPTARNFYRGTRDIFCSTKACCPSFSIEAVEWREAGLVR